MVRRGHAQSKQMNTHMLLHTLPFIYMRSHTIHANTCGHNTWTYRQTRTRIQVCIYKNTQHV